MDSNALYRVAHQLAKRFGTQTNLQQQFGLFKRTKRGIQTWQDPWGAPADGLFLFHRSDYDRFFTQYTVERLLTTLGLQFDEGNYSDQLSVHWMHPHCVAHYPDGYWLLAWPDQPLFRHSKHTLSKSIQAAARMAYVFTGVVQERYPLEEAAVREIIRNTIQPHDGCFLDMAASRVISDLLDLNHPYAGEIACYWADRVVQQMVEDGEVIRVRRFNDRAHSEILLRQPQLSSKQ